MDAFEDIAMDSTSFDEPLDMSSLSISDVKLLVASRADVATQTDSDGGSAITHDMEPTWTYQYVKSTMDHAASLMAIVASHVDWKEAQHQSRPVFELTMDIISRIDSIESKLDVLLDENMKSHQ